MKDVTLVGPHTDYDGKLRVKGETVRMTEEDADWYTKAIIDRRNAAVSQPSILSVSTAALPPSPADPTAKPDVQTDISSDQRDDWTPQGIAKTIKPLVDEEKETATTQAATIIEDGAAVRDARETAGNLA